MTLSDTKYLETVTSLLSLFAALGRHLRVDPIQESCRLQEPRRVHVPKAAATTDGAGCKYFHVNKYIVTVRSGPRLCFCALFCLCPCRLVFPAHVKINITTKRACWKRANVGGPGFISSSVSGPLDRRQGGLLADSMCVCGGPLPCSMLALRACPGALLVEGEPLPGRCW